MNPNLRRACEDASTFSNAYRERFGERPTDTRERGRAHHASRSLPVGR